MAEGREPGSEIVRLFLTFQITLEGSWKCLGKDNTFHMNKQATFNYDLIFIQANDLNTLCILIFKGLKYNFKDIGMYSCFYK